MSLGGTGSRISLTLHPGYNHNGILEDPMRVGKWGNSLAIRLPRSVVEVLGLKAGDDIEVHVAGRRTFEIERSPTSQELLRRLRKFRGGLPAGFRFDRLEANERN
jgi:antitoxin MazE